MQNKRNQDGKLEEVEEKKKETIKIIQKARKV